MLEKRSDCEWYVAVQEVVEAVGDDEKGVVE